MLFILNSNGVPSVASSVLLSSSSTPAPAVTSISPNSGTINGGTVVSITGTGFLGGATVSVGGSAATGVTVVNSTSITATTPAHAAGTVNVIVTNSDTQSGTLTQGFTYTTIQSGTDADRDLARVRNGRRWYSSDHNGHGIPGGSDGEPGRNTSHGCDGDEQHVDYSHHSRACGWNRKRDRDQQRYAERNVTQGFTYTTVSNPAPTLTGISPASGAAAGGTAVTITGTGFMAGATVSLGGTPATGVTVMNSTSITAITPAHPAGAVNVVVSNAEQQAGTLPDGYTYTRSLRAWVSVCPPGVQVRPL